MLLWSMLTPCFVLNFMIALRAVWHCSTGVGQPDHYVLGGRNAAAWGGCCCKLLALPLEAQTVANHDPAPGKDNASSKPQPAHLQQLGVKKHPAQTMDCT